MHTQNGYLFGYWQSEKYFKDIREELLKSIRFPEFSEENNIQYRDMILNAECPVSVHIRRGDYLVPKYYRQYGGVCTETYYQEAKKYFESRYDNVQFFVFTNDLEWVSQNFTGANVTLVCGNSGEKSFRDMQLMSLCRHNIIANSSFSWWAAWLNQNPDKIVITPPAWNRAKPTPDIWVPEWIKLDTPLEELHG